MKEIWYNQSGDIMFTYNINVLLFLKNVGYSQYRLVKKDKLLSADTIARLKKGEMISIQSLDVICTLLNCDISDIIRHQK